MWTIIAQIAIPSAIALLIGYWQVKTMRSIANVTENQQEFSTARANQPFQKIKLFILPSIGFLAIIFGVYIELASEKPLTRFDVFIISFNTTMLLFYIGSVYVGYLTLKNEGMHKQELQQAAENEKQLAEMNLAWQESMKIIGEVKEFLDESKRP